jgi:hypothetical protein
VKSGMRQRHALRPGSRKAGGGGTAVSGATEERAFGGFKNCQVLRERARGLKF